MHTTDLPDLSSESSSFCAPIEHVAFPGARAPALQPGRGSLHGQDHASAVLLEANDNWRDPGVEAVCADRDELARRPDEEEPSPFWLSYIDMQPFANQHDRTMQLGLRMQVRIAANTARERIQCWLIPFDRTICDAEQLPHLPVVRCPIATRRLERQRANVIASHQPVGDLLRLTPQLHHPR